MCVCVCCVCVCVCVRMLMPQQLPVVPIFIRHGTTHDC